MPKFSLEDLRTHLGCTQAELAGKLAISRRSIIRYEKTGEVPAALLPHLLSLVTGEPVAVAPAPVRTGTKSKGWVIDHATERSKRGYRLTGGKQCWTVAADGRADRPILITDYAALPAGFRWIETYMAIRPMRWWTYRREPDGSDTLIRMVRHNIAGSQLVEPHYLVFAPEDISPEELGQQPRLLEADPEFQRQERDKLSRLQNLIPIDEEAS